MRKVFISNHSQEQRSQGHQHRRGKQKRDGEALVIGQLDPYGDKKALDAIASSARIALDEQAGVDLDQEAANLVRFQQAFQASGKALQVASDIFDTLLGLK